MDKSSPLLGLAISDNEVLDAIFECYRTNQSGAQELYYTIKVVDATISDLTATHPHNKRIQVLSHRKLSLYDTRVSRGPIILQEPVLR
ncbi:type VI secretion system tube protein Hcp [Photorhabdus cinerea]|uniref:type VI secretion system tube protein Hcp n=1 Tax=Photorhabdus cinerea TaxID=471575 RepID=UPI0030DC5C88